MACAFVGSPRSSLLECSEAISRADGATSYRKPSTCSEKPRCVTSTQS